MLLLTAIKMGGKIPEHIIDQIRDRVSIREVVEDYVRLQKDGANYKGLCPFHQEKTPSFKVHEGKGIFKCFGCGEAGNVFGFIMKLEGMSFREAAERLARRAGIEIPREEEKPEERERRARLEPLFSCNREAAIFYNGLLRESAEAAHARDYLQRRGIGEESVSRFLIGYSTDDWDRTHLALEKKGLSISDLHGAGLVIENDRGGHYDRFRGRLMFPIFDVQGRVRGFGARLLKDDPGQPKYINTPETPVFKKGSGFFGIYQAKEAIRREGRVIIVEGYTDQIALFQAGIEFAVATLGTALTPEHAQVVRRYRPETFLVFDSDEAGKKASLRALEVLLEAELSPRIVVMPEGRDPDDFLRENGPDEFRRIMDSSPSLLGFYIETLLAEAGDTPSETARAVGRAAEMIGKVHDSIERSIFSDQLARKSGVPLSRVEASIRRPRKRGEGGRGSEGAGPASVEAPAFPQAEMDLLRILVNHPEMADKIRVSGAVNKLRNKELAELVQFMLDRQAEHGSVDPGSLIQRITDPLLLDVVTSQYFENDPFSDIVERAVEDVIVNLQQGDIETRLTSLRRRISEAQELGDEGVWRKLVEEQKVLLAEKKEIVSGRTG